jgi:hypothetical protein
MTWTERRRPPASMARTKASSIARGCRRRRADEASHVDSPFGGGAKERIDAELELFAGTAAHEGVEGADEAARPVAPLSGHEVEDAVADRLVEDVLGCLKLEPPLHVELRLPQGRGGEVHGPVPAADGKAAAVVRTGCTRGGKGKGLVVLLRLGDGGAVGAHRCPGAELECVSRGR